MIQSPPRYRKFVAEQKLVKYFATNSKERKEQATLQLFCENAVTKQPYMTSFLLRMLMVNVDYSLITAVLQSLAPNYKKYIYLKYTGHKNVVGLADALYSSPSQLNVWHDKVLNKIQDSLNFRLTVDDIYDRRKIINMQEALALILSTVCQLDPRHDVVDEYWLNAIGYFYNQYSQLYAKLNICLTQPEKSTMHHAVKLMSENPFAGKDELAEKVGCSAFTFGRLLRNYTDSVKDYVYVKQ